MDLTEGVNPLTALSISDQLSAKNKDCRTALHIAATGNNMSAVNTVCRLLAWKADISVMYENGELPSNLAKICVPYLNRMATADQLSQSNKDTSQEHGWTALMVASEIGDCEQIKFLLEEGTNINACNSSQQSALHIAASAGNADVVQLLLDKKAEFHLRDKYQFTPICCAARSGNIDTLRKLVEAKADVMVKIESNAKPMSVLDMARERFGESSECIHLLKSYGVDGWNLLMISVERGHYSAKQFLETRENLIQRKKNKPFTSGFQNDLWFYSNLQFDTGSWKWNERENINLVLSDDGKKLTKVNDSPDYSCALGDIHFDIGVHKWKLCVKNVRSMWAGVARHVSKDQLCVYPGQNLFKESTIIAFGSGGDIIIYGVHEFEKSIFSNFRYSSYMELEFELDTHAQSLSFSIDGKLAYVVSNVNLKGSQPYICMDYYESVEFVDAGSCLLVGQPLREPFADTLVGEQNSNYPGEFDAELLRFKPSKSMSDSKLTSVQGTFAGECFCPLSV